MSAELKLWYHNNQNKRCEWCETHTEAKKQQYYLVSVRNKPEWLLNLRFDHFILCEECVKEWIKDEGSRVVFAFKIPELCFICDKVATESFEDGLGIIRLICSKECLDNYNS